MDSDQRPPLAPPIETYQCCYCGGGGLDAHGETCEHCEGLGFC